MTPSPFYELWSRGVGECRQRLAMHSDVKTARDCGRELAAYYPVVDLMHEGVRLEWWTRRREAQA